MSRTSPRIGARVTIKREPAMERRGLAGLSGVIESMSSIRGPMRVGGDIACVRLDDGRRYTLKSDCLVAVTVDRGPRRIADDWRGWLDRINEAIDSGDYDWADSLVGIAEWVEENQHITDAQIRAVENILAAEDKAK